MLEDAGEGSGWPGRWGAEYRRGKEVRRWEEKLRTRCWRVCVFEYVGGWGMALGGKSAWTTTGCESRAGGQRVEVHRGEAHVGGDRGACRRPAVRRRPSTQQWKEPHSTRRRRARRQRQADVRMRKGAGLQAWRTDTRLQLSVQPRACVCLSEERRSHDEVRGLRAQVTGHVFFVSSPPLRFADETRTARQRETCATSIRPRHACYVHSARSPQTSGVGYV